MIKHPNASDIHRLAKAPPTRLLELVAGWLAEPRFAHFAALIRHPDLEQWIMDRLDARDADRAERGRRDWLTLLDRYFTDHLHQELTGYWLGKPERRADLKLIWDAVHELLAPFKDKPGKLSDSAPAVPRC